MDNNEIPVRGNEYSDDEVTYGMIIENEIGINDPLATKYAKEIHELTNQGVEVTSHIYDLDIRIGMIGKDDSHLKELLKYLNSKKEQFTYDFLPISSQDPRCKHFDLVLPDVTDKEGNPLQVVYKDYDWIVVPASNNYVPYTLKELEDNVAPDWVKQLAGDIIYDLPDYASDREYIENYGAEIGWDISAISGVSKIYLLQRYY